MRYFASILLTTSLALTANAASSTCRPAQQALIDSEVHCTDSGIDISYFRESGIKVACLEDRRVQRACGMDGELTRTKAFETWQEHLQTFSENCTRQGGFMRFG